jgi:hypothetical protein
MQQWLAALGINFACIVHAFAPLALQFTTAAW